MNRTVISLAVVLATTLAFVGCGPLDHPMPPRPDAESQKQIDDGWDRALTPVGKHDRQQWLDLLVGTKAYQAGVDSLTFRSEKVFSGGKVVMEVFYDRARPDGDRFVVTVYDRAGTKVREEWYNRDLVERTNQDLFDRKLDRQPNRPSIEARWRAIAAVFPKSEDAK